MKPLTPGVPITAGCCQRGDGLIQLQKRCQKLSEIVRGCAGATYT
jgi:hypothetical protein